ncbi:MAG: acetamidase/formamidase family protein [Proteobacteria bacterium]|nr:acetamidase/formamidase family protein [Pseudomonadota bacterium]
MARGAGSPQTTAAAAIKHDGPVLRWTPRQQDLVYTFGGASARQRIAPGTRIISWSEDCFDGAIKTSADLPSKVLTPGRDNPQTGPFHIEGAEPGDTLAIRLLSIEPARDYAVSASLPGFGALVGTDQTAMLGASLPEASWRYDVDAKRRVARTTSGDGRHVWEVPLAPFLGCIGVAPAGGEVRSTIVPGNFGGNLDCTEVRAGNTVFLGVNMPGALFSFGDGHYAMGDGEIMGAAIEGAMNVDLIVDLIKGVNTPIPRLENAQEVMFIGSGRPLEDAARVAYKAMVGWVREHTGLSELDAYQFVAQTVRAPIIQLVDPEYTVLVKLDKGRLPTQR